MSAARLTVTRANMVGVRRVRYGTPSTFASLGTVQRLANGKGWLAITPEGVEVERPSYDRAVAYLGRAFGLGSVPSLRLEDEHPLTFDATVGHWVEVTK